MHKDLSISFQNASFYCDTHPVAFFTLMSKILDQQEWIIISPCKALRGMNLDTNTPVHSL